eukprot:616134-Prymnesium_polylepis.2
MSGVVLVTRVEIETRARRVRDVEDRDAREKRPCPVTGRGVCSQRADFGGVIYYCEFSFARLAFADRCVKSYPTTFNQTQRTDSPTRPTCHRCQKQPRSKNAVPSRDVRCERNTGRCRMRDVRTR